MRSDNAPTHQSPGKRWLRALTSFGCISLAISLSVYLTRDFWLTTLRAYIIGRTYLAGDEFGRSLPAVDEVEILALDGEVKDGTPDSFRPDVGSRLGTVDRRTLRGAEAEKVAAIWRHIPLDQRFNAQCHEPYYALRFRRRGKLILETSICWHCSNVTLPTGVLGRVYYGFDAKSAKGQELLSTLTQYAPHPQRDEDPRRQHRRLPNPRRRVRRVVWRAH